MRIPTASQAYIDRVLATGPIAYWPLTEAAGAVANDVSSNDYHGAYTGVDLAQPGVVNECPYFDGANDYTNVYSAGLAAAFNGAAGTLMVWARVANAAVWTDNASRYVVNVGADVNNRTLIHKRNLPAGANEVRFGYLAGGTAKTVDITTAAIGWLCLAITWDVAAGVNGEMKANSGGTQQGTTQTALGAWAGALSATESIIGAVSTVPATVWLGWLAHAALWSRALSPTEVAEVSTL